MIYLYIYLGGYVLMLGFLVAFSVVIEDLDAQTIFCNSLLWPVLLSAMIFTAILERFKPE